MRLKNVKNAKNIVNSSNYIVEKPEDHKGNWNLVFNNKNEIHIEIGMGKGDFIIGMAKLYPNINFIGIEMFDSVMARAVQKLEEENIPNLKLIRMDAEEINEVFSKEIDCMYLNFSDPWPKERHEKRRLTHSNFLKRFDDILKKKDETQRLIKEGNNLK